MSKEKTFAIQLHCAIVVTNDYETVKLFRSIKKLPESEIKGVKSAIESKTEQWSVMEQITHMVCSIVLQDLEVYLNDVSLINQN